MVKCDMGKCEITGDKLDTIVRECCCLMAAVNEVIDKHMEPGKMRSMVKEMMFETAMMIRENDCKQETEKLITSEQIAQVIAEEKENGEV